MVGVCCSSPQQEEQVDEVYRQLHAASCLPALVLLRDFNHPSVCWRIYTARLFLEKQTRGATWSWACWRSQPPTRNSASCSKVTERV